MPLGNGPSSTENIFQAMEISSGQKKGWSIYGHQAAIFIKKFVSENPGLCTALGVGGIVLLLAAICCCYFKVNSREQPTGERAIADNVADSRGNAATGEEDLYQSFLPDEREPVETAATTGSSSRTERLLATEFSMPRLFTTGNAATVGATGLTAEELEQAGLVQMYTPGLNSQRSG
jgi:hypothetical protein